MGWLAITRKNEHIREEDGITEANPGGGRPVDAGNNNELLVVGAKEYGHSVAVDLVNGVIAIDWDDIGVQNGTVEIHNAKLIFSICEETNIIGEYKHMHKTRPDKEGNYLITYEDMIFRPIWFNRHMNSMPAPVVVIGAQATTPREQGKRNIKKMVSLFPDGRIGIS